MTAPDVTTGGVREPVDAPTSRVREAIAPSAAGARESIATPTALVGEPLDTPATIAREAIDVPTPNAREEIETPTIVVRPGVEFETAPDITASSAGASSGGSAGSGSIGAATIGSPGAHGTPATAASPASSTLIVTSPALASPAAVIVSVSRDAGAEGGTEAPPAREARDRSSGLSILMVASEAVPFAKTGGLADVAGALPVALGRLGHQVTLVLPRYRGVDVSGEPVVSRVVQLGPQRHAIAIYETPLGDGARAWLVDEPALFDRDGLYGANGTDHPDNPRRYALLARAALEGARAAGLEPDVVHAHDWQAGLAPVYLKTRFAQDPVLGGVPSVFTIHNVAFQGLCDARWLPELDLGWELFTPQTLEFWQRASFLKGGIFFSEKITTVSPRYAQEILTPEFAFGMEGAIGARRDDLVGILNGIDAETWNPATDRFIPTTYTRDTLARKADAKRALLQAYGLPSDDEALRTPLVGQVSRMTDQKGLDLIAQVAQELPQTGARFVILGTGEWRYEEMWRALARDFPDRIAAQIGFDEPLSHLLEAGSDLFLMPSRFEPCGLNQMYSLRYGTLPLVRATGGLDDTVENYDPHTGRGTGFKFWEASGPALLNTLRWALRVYEHPEVWQRLQRAAMQGDFSWDRSAREYAALYRQLARVRP